MRRSLSGCLFLLLFVACREADPVLRVAGLAWSEDELLGLSADRRALLAELAGFGLAVSDSALDALGEPRVRAVERRHLIELHQARRTLIEAEVDNEVLRARYLTQPRYELTVRHLLILSPRYETDARRAEARAKAERALARIRAGEAFPTVAAEVSEEPGAEGREGLLDPGREGSWVDEFWTAALALDPGEISGVVETEYGFHVLRLDDRQVVPFDEARPGVELETARMLGMGEDAPAPPPPALAVSDGLAARVEGDGSAVLASWTGGALTLDTARVVWAAWPHADWQATRSGNEERVREAVARAAAEVATARDARALGIDVPEAWMDQARRDWLRTAEGWATLLGFRPNMGREEVRAAARAALGATNQNAGLARDELRREATGLIHHAYDIETTRGGGA